MQTKTNIITCNKVDCTETNNNNKICNNNNNITNNDMINNRPITRSITRNNKQLSTDKVDLNGNDLNLTSNHNDKPSNLNRITVTSPTNNDTYNNCNCRKSNKINYPLQGNCLIKNVVYKVNVKCINSSDKLYIRSTGRHFKDRYTGHKYTFNHINKENSTILSDFV